MFVLFETASGYAVFKLLDEGKLEQKDSIAKDFLSPDAASKLLHFSHFEKFKDTTEALAAATSVMEGKINKRLKKVLKNVVGKGVEEHLAVADAKLAATIKEKMDISCVATSAVQELMSCIRMQLDHLIPDWNPQEEANMQLGLAHGIGRYKLKFSPDKVDTMIIQAVSLLDDLDKEMNNYVMRCKEWYGWHFPELSKIVTDNYLYVKTIKRIGIRTNAHQTDLSDLLPVEIADKVKEISEVSMGTEISEDDILNIHSLCDNISELHEYRSQLFEYLKNRMMAIAPNLTVLVGELVGARLVSKAGSLISLAKYPASTVQILGAEKALFRALKTKHDTPKYGLIYHAQLVGQGNPKLKGKLSRMLAAKAALACRVDALGEDVTNSLGIEHRATLETRLKMLEEGGMRRISGGGKQRAKADKYENKSSFVQYKAGADSTFKPGESSARKRHFAGESEVKEPEEDEADADQEPSGGIEIFSKKALRSKDVKPEADAEEEEEQEEPIEQESPKKKKKNKKQVKQEAEQEEEEEVKEEPDEVPEPPAEEPTKKKKKKK